MTNLNIPGWLEPILQDYGSDFLRSISLILVLIVLHLSIARALASNEQVPVDVRRHWVINVRNSLFIVGVLGLLVIWARELQTIALSMVAFAAAFVLATKEVLMCLAGGLVRSLSNSYSPGDLIRVGELRGRVLDINMLTTSILEIGPNQNGHQLTGHKLIFPNSLLLSHAVEREDFTGEYVMHIITVPLPYTVAPARAERSLLAIAQDVCAPHLDAAKQHMAMLEAKMLMDTPSVEPRIAIQPFNDKEYRLVVRMALPPRERQRIEQTILRRFLFDCFPEHEVAESH